MTSKEFFEAYEGRRVRVNERFDKKGFFSQIHIGIEGIVKGLSNTIYVIVALDNGLGAYFLPYELDVIEKRDNKPLPCQVRSKLWIPLTT